MYNKVANKIITIELYIICGVKIFNRYIQINQSGGKHPHINFAHTKAILKIQVAKCRI